MVTVMLLEDEPAVLSLGKLCEDHGYNYHWTSGQEPHLIKNGRRIDCNTANCVPFVVSGLSTSSSTSSSPHLHLLLLHLHRRKPWTLTKRPALTRSESMSEEVQGNVSHGPAEPKTQMKMTTRRKYEETCRYDLPEWLQECRNGLV